jgi:nucleoporin GLE1
MKNIVDTLKDALLTTPSPPVDPGMVMLSTPAPAEGSHNNGDSLPVLFVYLLNQFSKALVSQFVDEAGVAPKTADPIGIIAASVFAQSELCWRGTSLIDILICKMRVACPVLFGIRGNEKTEEGRARLGWRRGEGGEWVSDQVHNTRMTGLGAGYAAISLRNFSKSSFKNPYPPTMYWRSMASIVNTPPEEASSTQYIVLKAMIENYEQRFMEFYGSAARAALQIALVDFPGRAQENTVAVSSLKVLGDKLRRDVGLRLTPSSAKP